MSRTRVTGLLVEGRPEPLGVDVAQPRLRWRLEDAGRALRLLRSRLALRRDGHPDTLWSATIEGDELGATVVGVEDWRPLTRYRWQVAADVEIDGVAGTLRASSCFETGLLDEQSWHGAQWVTGAQVQEAEAAAAPLLRGALEVRAPVLRARLALAAGGIAAVTVNGVVPGDEVLGPGLTDYRHRVAVAIHDVTATIRPGTNVVAVALGRGFYAMTTENVWGWHRAPWHADPCVRAVLVVETTAGRQVWRTDADLLSARGGIRADSLLEGEVYDAGREPRGWRREGFDARGWLPARPVPGPAGRPVTRPFPGIRVQETLDPLSARASAPGRWVIDVGRHVAGWVRLQVPAGAPVGARLTLRSTERLLDGRPALSSPLSDGELQLDTLVLDGEPLTWEPQLGYKGFRYVEVEGWPDGLGPPRLQARVAHADVERTARFACAHDGLDWVHEAVVATMTNNLHHIPTDTPVYEKNGWTGDVALGAQMLLRDLDTVPLLEDWLESVADSCDPSGRPALIAPDPDWVWERHASSPPWHAVLWALPWRIYQATGDDRVLRRHIDGILRYLRLEHASAVDGLSDSGLGDYLAPGTAGNPDEDRRVCGTAAVYEGTRLAARIAALLGRADDAREMRARAELIRSSFRTQLLDPVTRLVHDPVAGFRQTHQVLAISAGLLETEEAARAAEAVAEDVRDRGDHLCVGALGVRRVLPLLDRYGHGATAFAAATTPTAPGWLAWRAAGASTMWEFWDDRRSRNHYFLGTIDDWLFADVAGLRLGAPGYRRVRVRPEHLCRLDHAEAEIATVRGDVALAWEVERGRGVLRLRLPPGTTAAVELPGAAPVEATGASEHRFAVGSET